LIWLSVLVTQQETVRVFRHSPQPVDEYAPLPAPEQMEGLPVPADQGIRFTLIRALFQSNSWPEAASTAVRHRRIDVAWSCARELLAQ
jgi:hypothetical protein